MNLPRAVIVLGLTSLLTDIGSEMIFSLKPEFLATLGGMREPRIPDVTAPQTGATSRAPLPSDLRQFVAITVLFALGGSTDASSWFARRSSARPLRSCRFFGSRSTS